MRTLALTLLLLTIAGCSAEDFAAFQAGNGDSKEPRGVPAVIPGEGAAVAPGDSIKIASFNIQVFGASKLKKPQVMDVLARVARRFDVVAIQEVRSTDDRIVPTFVGMINADGSHYDFVVGPRLGRTNSKEQYAF